MGGQACGLATEACVLGRGARGKPRNAQLRFGAMKTATSQVSTASYEMDAFFSRSTIGFKELVRGLPNPTDTGIRRQR